VRRLLYSFLLVLLLAGAFLSGSWFSKRKAVQITPEMNSLPSGTTEESEEPSDEDLSSMPPGTVNISPEKQQLIGVKLATVVKAPWSQTIRLLGRVVPDETRIYRINAATDGWITKILPVTTGSLVKKDELLATFYAPEFYSAMRAYLYGLSSLDRFKQSGTEPKEQIEVTDANIENYRNALRNLGMTEYQMNEIKDTRQGGERVEIRAPAAGFILVRNLSLGERFQRGTELYRIADLSKVWIAADIYENEARYFKPGVQATVTIPYQKKSYRATVSNVLPIFDPASRTLKVRLETGNPGFILRPDMFVDVELPVKLPPALTVPADAVRDSGLKKIVFVDRGNGFFEPRKVETGLSFGGRVEIVKGLKSGEQIAVSGTFLIDSESRLKTPTGHD
jgi:Cu(I)/Ag(I) efflux system membrane fusion protein